MNRKIENEAPKPHDPFRSPQGSPEIRALINQKLTAAETRQLILWKAHRIVATAGLHTDYLDEVIGSLFESLVRDSKAYDPQLGEWPPFAERSLQFAAKNLLRHWFAGKRQYGKTVNLHFTVQLDDVGPIELAQLITRRELEARTGAVSRSDVELSDLRLDISEFKNSLSPSFRELADALGQETILEISRRTGLPRSTLYGYLEVLRRAAEDRGLAKYLKE